MIDHDARPCACAPPSRAARAARRRRLRTSSRPSLTTASTPCSGSDGAGVAQESSDGGPSPSVSGVAIPIAGGALVIAGCTKTNGAVCVRSNQPPRSTTLPFLVEMLAPSIDATNARCVVAAGVGGKSDAVRQHLRAEVRVERRQQRFAPVRGVGDAAGDKPRAERHLRVERAPRVVRAQVQRGLVRVARHERRTGEDVVRCLGRERTARRETRRFGRARSGSVRSLRDERRVDVARPAYRPARLRRCRRRRW